MIGDVRDVNRFPGPDHFAAYHGTAPIEVSSGPRKVYRLSRRGNRRLNHAIHMAAVTQVRHRHSQGRGYYDKKLAEGKTPACAAGLHPRHRLFGQATPGPRHHPTTKARSQRSPVKAQRPEGT